MRIPGSDQVRGMRHVRGVMSAPSLNLWRRGRIGRARESANIAIASATLQANRRFLTTRRRLEGGCWNG